MDRGDFRNQIGWGGGGDKSKILTFLRVNNGKCFYFLNMRRKKAGNHGEG